jgi:Tfp pilus assembly protein PilO
MKQIDKQQVTILILGAVVLLGFGLFRYMPIVRKRMAIKEQMNLQSLSMEQIQEYSRLLPELNQIKRQLEEKLQASSGKIPEGKQIAQLWQQIAEVMNECKLQDQLVQPEAEMQSDELNCIPLRIECRGSLEQMFTFFQKLEKFERLISFEDVQLENSRDFDAELKLNAKANVYYQPSKSGNS